METRDVLLNIRAKHNLAQEEMAEKLFVTRQAFPPGKRRAPSRTETLKLISKTFGVSRHTLLGQPRNEICQV